MFEGVLAALPEWLVSAGALGSVCTVFVALAFVVSERVFPATRIDPDARVSGEGRRRTEIRAYLRAIREPFAEEHPTKTGDTAAFYLPEHDVAITFDARAYYRLGPTDTRAVLVEHEMPGSHLADRLPFETPAVEFDTHVETDATGAAFAVLGVSMGATTDEIKSAYRKKVKATHPDHGGDRESFRRVREAYTTAKQHTG